MATSHDQFSQLLQNAQIELSTQGFVAATTRREIATTLTTWPKRMTKALAESIAMLTVADWDDEFNSSMAGCIEVILNKTLEDQRSRDNNFVGASCIGCLLVPFPAMFLAFAWIDSGRSYGQLLLLLLVPAIWFVLLAVRRTAATEKIVEAALQAAVHLHSPKLIPTLLRLIQIRPAGAVPTVFRALYATLNSTDDFSGLRGNGQLLNDCRHFVQTYSLVTTSPILPLLTQIGGRSELKCLQRVKAFETNVSEEHSTKLQIAIEALQQRLAEEAKVNALLRPAEAPESTLLRPVSATETDNTVLVRPSFHTDD